MPIPLNRLLLSPLALLASNNSFSFSTFSCPLLVIFCFVLIFSPLPYSSLWINGMCMSYASHLWYGGSFPFFGQLWKYREDSRCALTMFLCRPPHQQLGAGSVLLPSVTEHTSSGKRMVEFSSSNMFLINTGGGCRWTHGSPTYKRFPAEVLLLYAHRRVEIL